MNEREMDELARRWEWENNAAPEPRSLTVAARIGIDDDSSDGTE